MKSRRPGAKACRSLLVLSLASSGVFLPLSSVLADQNSPAAGALIENQATATFVDSTDNSTQSIVSDKVQVTVAEVAGITAAPSTVVNPVYRTNLVYFDFLVYNTGNDPSQIFVPGAPSVATINGVALPASSIGPLQVIESNTVAPGTGVVTTTNVTTNNVVPAGGTATGNLTGMPNGGSVPAGGYIKVRVPITVPFTANTGDPISVTLGNTAGQLAGNSNVPYIVGANGTGGNDLHTVDNANGATGEYPGMPINGDATGHRQEASAVLSATVTAPPNVKVSGTVWDDANGSAAGTFTGIKDGTEAGANVTTGLNAILVDAAGNVVATTPVSTTGTYEFTVPGVQNGLYVILSTTTGVVGTAAPAATVPAAWSATSPLTYAAAPFNIVITDTTGKDFGIEQLPDTTGVSTPSPLANPPGTTKYQVPTLKGTDPEDGVTNPATPITRFKVVTLPTAAQGILYYNGVAVIAGDTLGTIAVPYDPTKLTFDPVDGVVNMTFTYASVDIAGRVDPSPATAAMDFTATPVGISGTVWNDLDGSATVAGVPGFTNIKTGTEVGTNAVFGTTTVNDNAILVDIATGNVLQSVTVAANGTYSFPNVPANTNVKVLLSPTPGTIGVAPPAAAAPIGWAGTSPQDSGSFNTGLYPITGKDFGIRQKAKLVLYKLITRVNGQTTNPNDGTDLSGVSTDTFNNVGNWPTNYLFGKTDAGKVQPGDTIEYTVYFMNNQGSNATSVKICDPVRGVQDYVGNSMKFQIGTGSVLSLTDIADADQGSTYAVGAAPTDCNVGAATSTGVDKGGVVITPPTIAGATGSGIPTNSYGLFRFTTKVQQ